MLRIPGQARGGQQQGGPRVNPCDRGGEKDALYLWESLGGSFLNARGRTASVYLSFFPSFFLEIKRQVSKNKKRKEKLRRQRKLSLHQLRKGGHIGA
eukprot:1145201-Pelagomonas_calceolata.AAC.5